MSGWEDTSSLTRRVRRATSLRPALAVWRRIHSVVDEKKNISWKRIITFRDGLFQGEIMHRIDLSRQKTGREEEAFRR